MAKQDSTAGRSIWEIPRPGFSTDTLTKDIRTEVLVIGAGITGSLVAQVLTSIGREVAVIDRNPPGGGSTAASTSLLLFEIDNPLVVLAEKIGEEKAARVWKRSYRAMRNLTEKVRELGIDCVHSFEHECTSSGTMSVPTR